jgi:hypothetical protein
MRFFIIFFSGIFLSNCCGPRCAVKKCLDREYYCNEYKEIIKDSVSKDNVAVSEIFTALKSTNSYIRQNAIYLIGEVGSQEHTEILILLLKSKILFLQSSDDDLEEINQIITALTKIGDERIIEPLTLAILYELRLGKIPDIFYSCSYKRNVTERPVRVAETEPIVIYPNGLMGNPVVVGDKLKGYKTIQQREVSEYFETEVSEYKINQFLNYIPYSQIEKLTYRPEIKVSETAKKYLNKVKNNQWKYTDSFLEKLEKDDLYKIIIDGKFLDTIVYDRIRKEKEMKGMYVRYSPKPIRTICRNDMIKQKFVPGYSEPFIPIYTRFEKAKSNEYLAKAEKEKGAKKEKSGLIYTIIKEGKGENPKPGDVVRVNYKGYLINGKVFDSSYERVHPSGFRLDNFYTIRCLVEGLQKIKTGGKIKLVCPSDIAYGDTGRPPLIPGGAAIIFEVELLEIIKKEDPKPVERINH